MWEEQLGVEVAKWESIETDDLEDKLRIVENLMGATKALRKAILRLMQAQERLERV